MIRLFNKNIMFLLGKCFYFFKILRFGNLIYFINFNIDLLKRFLIFDIISSVFRLELYIGVINGFLKCI